MNQQQNPKIDYESMDDEATFVPHHMRGAYQRFFERGYSPGSFGEAILDGNEEDAKHRADHFNAPHIKTQIAWINKVRGENAKA